MKHITLRSFTLLEMLLVIVIIGILLTLTLRFGGNRINELDTLTLQQEAVDILETSSRARLTSNYYQGGVYDKLTMLFSSGHSFVSTYSVGEELLGEETYSFSPQVSLDTLAINGKEQSQVEVSFVPYTLDCTVNSTTGSVFTFALSIDQETYCYRLSSACTFVEEVCK